MIDHTALIKQKVSSIDSAVPNIYRASHTYDNEACITGFGPASVVKRHPAYTHYRFSTRRYNDESCAAFKLLEFLNSFDFGQAQRLYWRVEPKVESSVDFDKFVGFARFSTDRELKLV